MSFEISNTDMLQRLWEISEIPIRLL